MAWSAEVPLTAPPSEKRLAAVLEHRFFLRLHMAAILTGTILVGLGMVRGLYLLHVNIFWIRYAAAVIAAYGAFVAFVKVWLVYITARSDSRWLDSINFSGGGSSSGSSLSSSSSGSSSFGGSGGKFGGGGASGGWSEGEGASGQRAAVAAVPIATQSGRTPTPSSSSSSKHGGGGGGGGGSSDDLGELILVVLIIAVVVATVASFIWLVWAAPGILSETAFNAALAGVLTKHAQKASNGDWIGSVMKKTAIPFVLILSLSIAMGAWAQHYCPAAVRLSDALPCIK